MTDDVKKLLKEKMPDTCLRLSFERSFTEALERRSASDWTDELLYSCIACVSCTAYLDIMWSNFKRGWHTPKEIEMGLKMYKHTPEFLRWLLDKLTECGYTEGAVIVQREIARRGLHEEMNSGRFKL